MYGYIYKIENLVNKKIYIGQTTQNPRKRHIHHFNYLKTNGHVNPHLQRAFNKYGESNFKFSVITWAKNQNELNKLEMYYMEKYDVLNPEKGYNLREGGSQGRLSEETKLKMSISTRKFYENNPGIFKGKNNPRYGKKHSLETRMKISESHKGKTHSLETRQKISKSRKGIKLSLEHRLKISKAQRGNTPWNKGEKAENNPFYGKHHSLESCNKISQSLKGDSFKPLGAIYAVKSINPWNKVWQSKIKHEGKSKTLGYFQDFLSVNIVYTIVKNELDNLGAV